jgi:hypothetical protein
VVCAALRQCRLTGDGGAEDCRSPSQFTEDDLEQVLGFIYTPDHLASMVVSRYPPMLVVDLYQGTLAEAIWAHFYGLHHVAVAGLIPMVEGIGREMAQQRGSKWDGAIKAVFSNPFQQAKDDVLQRRIGATHEIVAMLEAFLHFLKEYFFKDS